MNLDELNKAYEEAALGPDTPDLAVGICPVCFKPYMLAARTNDLCEHMVKLLDRNVEPA